MLCICQVRSIQIPTDPKRPRSQPRPTMQVFFRLGNHPLHLSKTYDLSWPEKTSQNNDNPRRVPRLLFFNQNINKRQSSGLLQSTEIDSRRISVFRFFWNFRPSRIFAHPFLWGPGFCGPGPHNHVSLFRLLLPAGAVHVRCVCLVCFLVR